MWNLVTLCGTLCSIPISVYQMLRSTHLNEVPDIELVADIRKVPGHHLPRNESILIETLTTGPDVRISILKLLGRGTHQDFSFSLHQFLFIFLGLVGTT